MSKVLFGLAWMFIVLAAGYDTFFAWQHRAVFKSWELNPLALWVAGTFGFGALLALKGFGIAFAMTMACYCRQRRPNLERSMTLILASSYALLSLHYVIGLQQPIYSDRGDSAMVSQQ